MVYKRIYDGCHGRASGEARWIENDGYNAPYWDLFIVVPFKNPIRIPVFSICKDDVDGICDKLETELIEAYERCTLF